ncbi:MAG: FctA domain-containing protein [Bifidobacterium choerinum]
MLVLDTSGSMAWNMDGETNTYYPICSSDPGYSESSDRYSILVDGAYQHIRYFPSPYGWGYYPNNVQDPTKPNYGWKTVVPKTSASDRDRNHVQFYEHGPIAEKDTRLHALKQAVHGFIDQTIADTGGQKNRVGLVTYASEATVNSGLTFTKADAGKRHCYGISELVPQAALPGPDGALALDGVTYDTGEHTACLAVTDTGEGTLAVHTTVDGADTTVAAFVNRYDIAPATHALTFRKSLTGRDWKEGGLHLHPHGR